jgi:hypothetical protein
MCQSVSLVIRVEEKQALMKRRNVPTLKKPEPIIGIIQDILLRALHPNQNRQMGMKKLPALTKSQLTITSHWSCTYHGRDEPPLRFNVARLVVMLLLEII